MLGPVLRTGRHGCAGDTSAEAAGSGIQVPCLALGLSAGTLKGLSFALEEVRGTPWGCWEV